MRKLLFCALIVALTGCSHKILVKNCEPTETDYSVCDSLNLLGK